MLHVVRLLLNQESLFYAWISAFSNTYVMECQKLSKMLLEYVTLCDFSLMTFQIASRFKCTIICYYISVNYQKSKINKTCILSFFYSDRQRWDLNGQQQNQIMNDADLMSSAYATYAQNIATLGAIENHSLIDQLQSLLKSNGVQAHSSGALQRKLSTEQVSEPLRLSEPLSQVLIRIYLSCLLFRSSWLPQCFVFLPAVFQFCQAWGIHLIWEWGFWPLKLSNNCCSTPWQISWIVKFY